MVRIKIRRYKKQDKEDVRKLILDVWGKEWLKGVMHAYEDYEAFIAEKNGEVIGGITLDEGSFSYLLDELIVKKTYQEQGVGSALLNYAIDYANKKGARFVKGYVEANNKSVIKMYERRGFEIFGRISNAFKIGDEYVYLCKFL